VDKVEQKIIEVIDENKQVIVEFARDIYKNAELGYKEARTAEKVKEILSKNTKDLKDNLAITGVKGYLKELNDDDINIALIGELDAIVCPGHVYANKSTGASHSCGHHAQLAGIIGASIALAHEEIINNIEGNVIFFGVPSEEYGEIEFKNSLKDKNLIKYGGGKSELIRIGEFDDVDIAVVHHTRPGLTDVVVGDSSSNGFLSKLIKYKGKASHAAGTPHLGINALNAANIGLNALSYQRETFKDEDSVRVHPIITKGGNLVNVVPDEVVIETLVRGKSIEAILDADRKVNRSFKSGAIAIGAEIEITTLPGYLPVIPPKPSEIIFNIAKEVIPNGEIRKTEIGSHMAGSTDVGDLTHILPVLKFETGGVKGALHSEDFNVVDEEVSYIVTAKIMALTAYRLLKEKASEAKKIKDEFKPKFTIKEYVNYMDKLENTFKGDYKNE
jgi:amidohydrolase